MVKKVVIAAGGRGTRMLHLTDDKPKHLIKIEGRPFLFYVLDSLLKAGYKELVLVTGYKKEMVEKFVRYYLFTKSGELKITFANQYEQFNPKEAYGTACPLMLKKVQEAVGSDQFLFLSGDNLYSDKDLASMNVEDKFCYVAGIKQDYPEKYGVLIEEEGYFLEKVIEKPEIFVGNLVNAGLYKFTSEVFEKLSQVKKSPRGEYELTDAVSLLAKEKKVKIKKIEDYWHDFGSPEDIEKLAKFLVSREV